MLPSSICKIDAVRMYCTPTVCCVQPTAYANAVVRSRPLLSASRFAMRSKTSRGVPHTSSTISGV